MKAILHTRSGKKLTVDYYTKVMLPSKQLAKDITRMYNNSGMRDKVIWTEVHLF